MGTSDLLCSKCGETNTPEATFCINCGKRFSDTYRSGVKMIDREDMSQRDRDREKFIRRLPMRLFTIVLLIVVDWIDNQVVDWAYYPAGAIAIFAVLIPIIKYRGDLADRRKRE